MCPSVLVLGGSGFMGSYILESLLTYDCRIFATSTHHDVNFHSDRIKWHYYNVDHYSTDLKYIILETQPDIIINTIVAGLPICQNNPELADLLNHELNRIIVDFIRDTNIQYFLLSSSYVFDNIEDAPNETISPQPQSVYGQTKLAGEQVAQELGGRCHIIRVTTVWGEKLLEFQHSNLLLDVNNPEKQQTMTIFDNVYRTPTIASQVADAITDYVFSDDLQPVIHLTHNQLESFATWLGHLPATITDKLTFASYDGNIIPLKSGLTTIYPRYSTKLDTPSFLQQFN